MFDFLFIVKWYFFGRLKIGRKSRKKIAFIEFNRALSNLNKGSYVIDCGANVGEFTKLFLEKGFIVDAFEPDPIAINELKKNKIPYIVLFADPVAGGITASYAMLGDIQIAEPGALIAFAGRRVIEGTVKEELPENFQKSEHVQTCGFVDTIIQRKDLPEKIGILLSILLKRKSGVKIEDGDKTSEDNIENREAS